MYVYTAPNNNRMSGHFGCRAVRDSTLNKSKVTQESPHEQALGDSREEKLHLETFGTSLPNAVIFWLHLKLQDCMLVNFNSCKCKNTHHIFHLQSFYNLGNLDSRQNKGSQWKSRDVKKKEGTYITHHNSLQRTVLQSPGWNLCLQASAQKQTTQTSNRPIKRPIRMPRGWKWPKLLNKFTEGPSFLTGTKIFFFVSHQKKKKIHLEKTAPGDRLQPWKRQMLPAGNMSTKPLMGGQRKHVSFSWKYIIAFRGGISGSWTCRRSYAKVEFKELWDLTGDIIVTS